MSYPFKSDITKFKEMIRETKKYASEKGVPNWNADFVLSMYMIILFSFIITLYLVIILGSIDFLRSVPATFLRYAILSFPFLLSIYLVFKVGKYIIKLMILKSWYMQKLTMKLINKLDMYLWRKTGKDSVISSAIVKYKIPIGVIFWIPIIIIILVLQ